MSKPRRALRRGSGAASRLDSHRPRRQAGRTNTLVARCGICVAGEDDCSRSRPACTIGRIAGGSIMQITLNVNGESRTADVDDDTPLLWVLRESLGLTGTKFGCGVAACGACTVHVNGTAVRSCSVPAA